MPTTTISRCGGGSSLTYAQRIILLKATYTCVAEWRLSDGASPYADTSGYAPADPATLVRLVKPVPMTQAYASGPLTGAGTGPSVAFNYDGDAITTQGDLLQATDTTPARYQFAVNAPFTIVGWVIPGAGVNTHLGPAISTVHSTGGTRDDGWRLLVNQPTLIPQIQRAAAATTLGQYDTASGPALSTAAWSLLVGTYDGATLTLYVDGAAVGTAASAGAIGGAANNATLGEGPHLLGDYGTWYYGGLSQSSLWAACFTPADVASLWADR